jgi:hypothetical protein
VPYVSRSVFVVVPSSKVSAPEHASVSALFTKLPPLSLNVMTRPGIWFAGGKVIVPAFVVVFAKTRLAIVETDILIKRGKLL